jgi:hypothetical protein
MTGKLIGFITAVNLLASIQSPVLSLPELGQ